MFVYGVIVYAQKKLHRYWPWKTVSSHFHILSYASTAYCLISYRAEAWHYRIFPDFLNSGFKMASKTEGKAEVIACSWNDIKGQITPES